MKMANPALKGYLEKLVMLADERISIEPASTPLRFYHILMKYIDRALGHTTGVGDAVQEIMAELGSVRP